MAGESTKSPFKCMIFFVIPYSHYYRFPETKIQKTKQQHKNHHHNTVFPLGARGFLLSSEDNVLLPKMAGSASSPQECIFFSSRWPLLQGAAAQTIMRWSVLASAPLCYIQKGPRLGLGSGQPPGLARRLDLKLPSLRLNTRARQTEAKVDSIH